MNKRRIKNDCISDVKNHPSLRMKQRSTEQEIIYKESELADAFLDVQLLLKAGVCKLVVMDEEMNRE